MLKRFTLNILILMMATSVLIGCVSSMQPGEQGKADKGQATREFVPLPERAVINQSRLPGDVDLVMAALINMLRGGNEILPNVGFDSKGSHGFLDNQFPYTGFDVKYIDVLYYKTEDAFDNVRYTLLEGGFYFADSIGRAAYVKFLVDYAVSKKDIIIANCTFDVLPNPYPPIEAYVVPTSIIESAAPEVKNSYRELYLLALQNALIMDPTPEEQQAFTEFKNLTFIEWLKYKSDKEPQDYCVMIFCKERLTDESQFIMTVSVDKQASDHTLAEPLYINDNGWLMGAITGNFALDAYNKEIFFHIQYNSGIEPGVYDLSHIYRFSTLKNYSSELTEEAENPYEKPFLGSMKKEGLELPKPEPEKIETISVLLDPSVPRDARLIQQRLAYYGFYKMEIDGAFGKGSRKALQAFKEAVGLGKDSVWNIETQRALFKGSGL